MKDQNKGMDLTEHSILEQKLGMNRRGFIKMVGIGLAMPTIVAACSTGNDDDDDNTTTDTIDTSYFPQSLASGDPTSDSVVLWTRIVDPNTEGPYSARLRIASDEAISNVLWEQELTTVPDYDNILKIKVSDGLEAGTQYYYQFGYLKDGAYKNSNVGRTKTAPAADSDVTVKFTFVSCQDYSGRYYNTYLKMLELDDLDFIVHLGDYIYETTADPDFQDVSDDRKVEFTDLDGALARDDHYAAQSLSNYRELYQTYRSDEILQKIHERFPMINTWDDHEFTDDAWQDNATYFDGQKSTEQNTERKKNAERAFFEYMPSMMGLNEAGDGISIDDSILFDNTKIYRDFVFGKNVHLILTDTRTFRPDHAIKEDDFYGRILIEEGDLPADTFSDSELEAYIHWDDVPTAQQTEIMAALTEKYQAKVVDSETQEETATVDADTAAAKAEAALTGYLAISALNGMIASDDDKIDDTDQPKGLSLNKIRYSSGEVYANDGQHARYMIGKKGYEAWRSVEYGKNTDSQNIFGTTQENWFLETVQNSTSTWKVIGNSISMTSMVLDVSDNSILDDDAFDHLSDEEKASLAVGMGTFRLLLDKAYLFNVDQWDGFPDKREAILEQLRQIQNCVLIAGDIHSSYVANHGKGDSGDYNVFEFTGAGIASETFKGFVYGALNGISIVKSILDAGGSTADSIIEVVENLENFLKAANDRMTYANNSSQGFVAIEASSSKMTTTFYHIPEEHINTSYYDKADEIDSIVETEIFTIENNTLSQA